MSAEATNAVTSLVANKFKRTAILAAGLFGLVAIVGYFIKRASKTVTPAKCSCCPCTAGKNPVVGYCRNCRLACCQLCSWYDNHKEQYQHTACPLELPICCQGKKVRSLFS